LGVAHRLTVRDAMRLLFTRWRTVAGTFAPIEKPVVAHIAVFELHCLHLGYPRYSRAH